jgi:fido (protein-threonine AMPylation protein)
MSFAKPIPGETPIADISELKVKGIHLRSQLNRVEAANITRALAQYLVGSLSRKDAPFDFTWVCELHRRMFEEVLGWAGRLRKSVTSIGIEPKFIEGRLFDLTQNLPYWDNEPLLLQATMLHHQAVQIHPFENGNGRWSRALANIWLRLNGHELTQWPGTALAQESAVRGEYIAAIKAADQGNYESLLELHTRFTPTAKPS